MPDNNPAQRRAVDGDPINLASSSMPAKDSSPAPKSGINSKLNADNKLAEVVELCKRRGFVFPNSEIYGGFSASYDYGPLGSQVLKNLRDVWIEQLVARNRNIVAMDGSIISHPRTWEASGHVEKFNDPLVEDEVTHQRYRADHVIEAALGLDTTDMTFEQMQQIITDRDLRSPDGNRFLELKSFNLMVQADLGATEQSRRSVFLRGETCQNIFVNYSNLVNSSRLAVPFGVVQIGKVFRNEVTTKQFILRTREFEQMEFEFFVDPEDSYDWYGHWQEYFLDLLDTQVGLPKDRFRYRELADAERSHYAKQACDLEFQLENGDWLEVSPMNHRGDWDLSRHSEFSGKKMTARDPQTGRTFTPNVLETSFGLGRLFYLAMDYGLRQEPIPGKDETRTVLKLSPVIAPVQLAILPLSKKPALQEVADNLWESLAGKLRLDYDESGSIGKRYRRQDEIGTPWCVTIDFDSLQDNAVTIRDRDSMQQERISMDRISEFVNNRLPQ